MKLIHTGTRRAEFNILVSSRSAQAAMMTLCVGGTSSDRPENEHPFSEQWLFVIRGNGRAVVGKRSVQLKANDLLLIEKGERHQIVNTGRTHLITLNLYVPRACDGRGDVLKRK
jgi:mannose-6-phosphate isomerase-like protein (cupin superfamily)